MDINDTQTVGFSGGARSIMNARESLRRFKRTPRYRELLQQAMREAKKGGGVPTEQRRAKFAGLEAELELQRIRTGEPLTEFSGLLRLPDPLEGR